MYGGTKKWGAVRVTIKRSKLDMIFIIVVQCLKKNSSISRIKDQNNLRKTKSKVLNQAKILT